MDDRDQTKTKTVLVTGASSGIGLATAVATAQAGFTTVATVRSLDRADPLKRACAEASVDVEIALLDVTDSGSVTTCVERVLERHGRLDALVNNAGAAHLGTLELDSMAGIRAALEVNFFGVVAMSQAAMPHLRSTRGRLVTVSSVGGVVGQPFNEAYCAAKFAVEGFMESLAPVAATVGVTVVIVEPGAVASSFVANSGVDPTAMISGAGPYAPAMTAYLERTMAHFAAASQSSQEVAELIVSALTDPAPAVRMQTSDAARAFISPKLRDLDGSAVQALTRTWVTSAS